MATRTRAQNGATRLSAKNEALRKDAGTILAPSGPLTERPLWMASRPNRAGDPFVEIGTSGLRQFGGFVLEEWLQQLESRREPWAYREMMDNDAVTGGILFAINQLARKVSWWVEAPEGGDSEDAQFAEECMHDMSQAWPDFVQESLSFAPYGWCYSELCYKRRLGPQKDTWSTSEESPMWVSPWSELLEDSSPASSKYKDGKIGWRKIPSRAQETLLRWHFDGYAGINAMEQVDWHGGTHVIPIKKALLFRTVVARNNPQGRSILRNAWTSYYAVKNLQALEAIGAERDLAGIPVITPPEDVDIFASNQSSLLEEVKKMVTSVRRDEYEGIVLPSGKWKFELVKSGGQRQVNTDDIIRRYEQRIAASVLADFILIGLDALGSYAMVDVKSDIFGSAMDSLLDLFCEPINRYAIPRLMALNGRPVENTPMLRHSSAGRIDLEKVGRFFNEISAAGAPIPWTKELIGQLFTEGGLPIAFDGETLETREYPQGTATQVRQEPGHGRPARAAAGVQKTERNEPSQLGTADRLAGRPRRSRERFVSGTGMTGVADYEDYCRAYDADVVGVQKGVTADMQHGMEAGLAGEPRMTYEEYVSLQSDPSAPSYQAYEEGHMAGQRMKKGEAAFTSEQARAAAQAAGVDWSQAPFTLEQLRVGMDAELEHYDVTAGSPIESAKIALAHLRECPDYYERLAPMEAACEGRAPLGEVHKAEIDLAPALRGRASSLSVQLEREIESAMLGLGEQAARAYNTVAEKAGGRARVARLVARAMRQLDVRGWVNRVLMPILRNHAERVAGDTARTVGMVTGQEVRLAADTVQAIAAKAGQHLRAQDIEPQVREAIMRAIEESERRGENPLKTAERIRDSVPAGRFRHAGNWYRAQLIAREETSSRQLDASLASYEAMPNVIAVKLRDGIYGPPRSDSRCMARDGEEVPIAMARGVHKYHIGCTLGMSPVVQATHARQLIPS